MEVIRIKATACHHEERNLSQWAISHRLEYPAGNLSARRNVREYIVILFAGFAVSCRLLFFLSCPGRRSIPTLRSLAFEITPYVTTITPTATAQLSSAHHK